jgi:hypothetical protein
MILGSWQIGLLLAGLLAASSIAHARGGLGAAGSANFRNPKNLAGLCVPEADDNNRMPFVRVGYCKSLQESVMTPGSCVNKRLEQMRKRYLNPKADAEAKDPNQKPMYLSLECSKKAGPGGSDGKSIDDIAKKPKLFQNLFIQFMALAAIEESDWAHQRDQKSAESSRVLLNLDKKVSDADMDRCKKECWPKSQNKAYKFSDPHTTLICGSFFVLERALKDGELFSGRKKDPDADGKDTRKGAARLFAAFEDPPPETPGGPAQKNTAEKRREGKIERYCQQFGHSEAWVRELKDITLDGPKDGSTER